MGDRSSCVLSNYAAERRAARACRGNAVRTEASPGRADGVTISMNVWQSLPWLAPCLGGAANPREHFFEKVSIGQPFKVAKPWSRQELLMTSDLHNRMMVIIDEEFHQ